jgi:hypothetical protein
LSLALLIQTRVDFLDAKPAAGADDLLCTFALARNLGAKGPMISVLVQDAVESNALKIAAANLDSFNDAELADFAKRIASLPAPYTLAESLTLGERMSAWARANMVGKTDEELSKLFDEMFRGEPDAKRTSAKDLLAKIGGAKGIAAQIDQIDAYYNAAAKVAALPWEQFKPANQELIDPYSKSNAELVKLQMPALQKAKEAEVRLEIKRQMLRAAIVRRGGGQQGFEATTDPTTGKPFQIEIHGDGGFTLKSPFDEHGKPTQLEFGKSASR